MLQGSKGKMGGKSWMEGYLGKRGAGQSINPRKRPLHEMDRASFVMMSVSVRRIIIIMSCFLRISPLDAQDADVTE